MYPEDHHYKTIVHLGYLGPIQPAGSHKKRIDVMQWLLKHFGARETWLVKPYDTKDESETRQLYEVTFEKANDQLLFEIAWNDIIVNEET